MDMTRRIDLGTIESTEEEQRSYVGASGVGKDCDLALQYDLRGYPQKRKPPAVLRILEMGHIIEELVVTHLRKAGYAVLEVDRDTGKQFEYTAFGGHVRGHADGMILVDDVPHVLEIKSMNDKKWTAFKNQGVASSHALYYAQVQLLMGLSGIQNSVIVAYNKNNSLYHYEFVDYDHAAFVALIIKAWRVVRKQSTKQVSDNPLAFVCRYCNYKPHCWPSGEESLAISVECKTCRHARPVGRQRWFCTQNQTLCSDPCGHWSRIEPEK